LIVAHSSDNDHAEELRHVAKSAQHDLIRVPGVRLSKKLRQILALLMRRERLHKEVIYAVLYPDIDERPEPSIVDQLMLQLRKKIGHLVEIQRDKSDGCWRLSSDHKKKLQELLEREQLDKPIIQEIVVGPIEKGIELPTPDEKEKRRSRFPFEEMVPGDSFLVRGASRLQMKQSIHHFRTARKVKHPDWKFTTRLMPDGAVRVWRIA